MQRHDHLLLRAGLLAARVGHRRPEAAAHAERQLAALLRLLRQLVRRLAAVCQQPGSRRGRHEEVARQPQLEEQLARHQACDGRHVQQEVRLQAARQEVPVRLLPRLLQALAAEQREGGLDAPLGVPHHLVQHGAVAHAGGLHAGRPSSLTLVVSCGAAACVGADVNVGDQCCAGGHAGDRVPAAVNTGQLLRQGAALRGFGSTCAGQHNLPLRLTAREMDSAATRLARWPRE